MYLTTKQLDTIKAYFQDKPVKRAYVFGSYAHGRLHPHSDIDILVELDYQKPIGLLFIRMQRELESLLEKKVDLISVKGLSKHLKPEVDREKALIYAR